MAGLVDILRVYKFASLLMSLFPPVRNSEPEAFPMGSEGPEPLTLGVELRVSTATLVVMDPVLTARYRGCRTGYRT